MTETLKQKKERSGRILSLVHCFTVFMNREHGPILEQKDCYTKILIKVASSFGSIIFSLIESKSS